MIKITFPDGSIREYEKGVTGKQIAESISPALARSIVSCGVNGETIEITALSTRTHASHYTSLKTSRANTASGIQAHTCLQRLYKNCTLAYSSDSALQ